MLNKIVMPSGGQTTNESLIYRWNKHVGDRIKRGDILFEIETDKAALEVESYCEGTLLKTFFEEGDSVAAGTVVAYIGEEGDLPEAAEESEGKTDISSKQSDEQNADQPDEEYIPIIKTPSSDQQQSQPDTIGRTQADILASPAAKKAAKELNVDINELGKTLGVEIVKINHVLNAVSQSSSDKSEYELIKPSRMRTTIARRMIQSAAVPAFTAEITVNMARCIQARNRINGALSRENLKISYNDILMKCIATAIGKVPSINTSWTDEGIRKYNNVHCGLAVGIEDGLVVPVVRDVQNKSIVEIAQTNAENIDKARQGTLSPEEQEGGTITLSNLGMFGLNSFTAILNPPEACILAVGAIIEQPAIVNGEVFAQPTMSICGSFDHRVIDGATGASFLKELQTLLESPDLLLLSLR